MKIAIPIWEGRVSPVMDTARELLVVEATDDDQPVRSVVDMPPLHFTQKARLISDLGIDALICGAISRQLEYAIAACGIEVIPWVRGDVDEIVSAYVRGNLQNERFFLPGCRGGGRRHRRGRGRGGQPGWGRGRLFREDV